MTTTETDARIYPGSKPGRQAIGLPGHCDRCALVGHVKAHPSRGCADVGCESSHERLPVCPPCTEVILALPWFEVQLGDLVLYSGRFTRLEAMWPATDDSQWLGITVLHGGASSNHLVPADDLAAVKRYVTEG